LVSSEFEPSNSIIADHVTRQVAGKSLLIGITLQIFQGEVFGIVGRSGSGKSLLLRVLAGLDRAQSGRVVIQSAEDDESGWMEAVPAIALQRPGLVPELSVQQNLLLYSRLWGIPRRGRSGRIAKYLEMLGLAEVRTRLVGKLSHGEAQRVELARALLPESLILMIDGLTDTLPEDLRKSVWRHLQKRARSGGVVIVATSDAREAELCERIGVLEAGRLVFVGAPEELIRSAGPQMVVVQAVRAAIVRDKIRERLGVVVREREGGLLFATEDGEGAVNEILGELGSDVTAVYVRRPSLADALEKL